MVNKLEHVQRKKRQPSFPMMKDNKMPNKCCSCNLSIFYEKPDQILRFRSVANMLAHA